MISHFKIIFMTLKDLKNINTIIRKMVIDHLESNNITLSQFCRNAGVHQSQMYMYLYADNAKVGLTTRTLEKVGSEISSFKKKPA
tara:strand:+ start:6019 stop:6273 length:255 start_codon:yes stop_codon:yes gene_type:complete